MKLITVKITHFPVSTMRKISLFISAAIAGLALVGSASNAKADVVQIIAKDSCSRNGIIGVGLDRKVDVGHVVIAFYDGRGDFAGTAAMWPTGVKYGYSEDVKLAKGIGCNIRTRSAYVTKKRREWLQYAVATDGGTDCKKYSYVYENFANKSTCTCVNFGTRVWRVVTSDWERWQFQITPKQVRDQIGYANGKKNWWDWDYQANNAFNGGIVWK
jgi:hypothetical protein